MLFTVPIIAYSLKILWSLKASLFVNASWINGVYKENIHITPIESIMYKREKGYSFFSKNSKYIVAISCIKMFLFFYKFQRLFVEYKD